MLTACTIFNPWPSIADMIMHKFGMLSDCQNYNLLGQGSSGGVMLVSLARDLLTVSFPIALANTEICLPCPSDKEHSKPLLPYMLSSKFSSSSSSLQLR